MIPNRNGFTADKSNAIMRSMLTDGITEDDFIAHFDEIMKFSGFRMFQEEKPGVHYARLVRMSMKECLDKIHRMNPTENSWAESSRISEKLKVFLKLMGEEI